MKSADMLNASDIALAAMSAHVYGPNFMTARKRAISLKPTGSSTAGYVWRRVFLGRGGRSEGRQER